MTWWWRHQPSYDTHHAVVINRAKFNACTCSSLRVVETDRIALYILAYWCIDASFSDVANADVLALSTSVLIDTSIDVYDIYYCTKEAENYVQLTICNMSGLQLGWSYKLFGSVTTKCN